MGTTTKALSLLEHFSTIRPEIGLSDFARLAKMDKATVYRLLTELSELGFVEQNNHSKFYRMGPAVIRLSNIRESTFPTKKAASQHLVDLVEDVHETAHVSVLQGTVMSPIHSEDSHFHATRVSFDTPGTLPMHATASGCAVLAFSGEALLDQVLSGALNSYTPETLRDPDSLRRKIEDTRKTGFSQSNAEFEVDVHSIGAPLFGDNGNCTGAVSVALPKARFTEENIMSIRPKLAQTAIKITKAWGGQIPADLQAIWKDTLNEQ